MAITLANCKLESFNWCHSVRIKVLHMTSYSNFGNFLNENSQKLFKKVRNSHNFGYIQVRELHLVSFCAYCSFPYDIILKIWNLWIFMNKKCQKLLKKLSGMAITLAKYKLGSSSRCHFVRIGVCQMILYSKRWNF
jgi:hypothetical protein